MQMPPPRTDSHFASAFQRATGHPPYRYQQILGAMPTPPSVISVPTGSGKTFAALLPWLLDTGAPRRLVYALPMRSLVEQTASVVREALRRLDDTTPVHVLMGGTDGEDWRRAPGERAILVGTIDMLLSAALNRGYGASRFGWPVAFGLLHNDCRWVFDEVQLMGPARATSAQLHGLRAALGTARPCETIWMSATVDPEALSTVDYPHLGPVLGLGADDRAHPQLAARLNAVKRVERREAAGLTGAKLAGFIASATLEFHRPATRTIVVVNRVELAQKIHAALQKASARVTEAPHTVLLHSRYRPPDRAARMSEAVTDDIPATGSIIVATQVIEAGVDLTSELLVTETAPFSSIVQRLGRCNRDGRAGEATVLWIDRGDLDAKAAAPYDSGDLGAARDALLGLVGQSASPSVLEEMDVLERHERTAVLRRRDLLDLFDTAPDLSGTDLDVAPYIRADDERTVSVFFRDLGSDDVQAQGAPDRDELVSIPIGSVKGRAAWTFDIHADRWITAQRIPPGAVVMLDRVAGGYRADAGWTGKPVDVPELVATVGETEMEAMAADLLSVSQARWISLSGHLADARRAAMALVEELALGDAGDAVVRAAALHDIGKAHPAFQELLRSSVPAGARLPSKDELWAKSPHRGGRNPRRHFRHELLSALVLGVRGIDTDPPESRLVRYLVAAHHGRVRTSIRPAVGEGPPSDAEAGSRFALGIVDGDGIPIVQTPVGEVAATTVDLASMELGGDGSWTDMALELRDEHGPFTLAYLEALVRIADWSASA